MMRVGMSLSMPPSAAARRALETERFSSSTLLPSVMWDMNDVSVSSRVASSSTAPAWLPVRAPVKAASNFCSAVTSFWLFTSRTYCFMSRLEMGLVDLMSWAMRWSRSFVRSSTFSDPSRISNRSGLASCTMDSTQFWTRVGMSWPSPISSDCRA